MQHTARFIGAPLSALALTLALVGCSALPGGGKSSGPAPKPYTQSDDGAGLRFGGPKDSGGAQVGIGVNAYLWRAALDTISFMPLASADPFGGVIITDWYTNPEKTDERFKATVYILDGRLRADALKVAVHKQVYATAGWVDDTVASETEVEIENAVLARARQLKLSGLGPSRK